MKVSRMILLVLMLTLLSFVGKAHAYTCLQICQNHDDACVAACDGNTNCEGACTHQLINCVVKC
jgi:hypothetical protein